MILSLGMYTTRLQQILVGVNRQRDGRLQRVMVYVDGFNLYFGLRANNWQRYYWLNVYKLAQNMLKPNQQLVGVKYFTSRIFGDPNKVDRQSAFLDALGTLDDFEIFYGNYQPSEITCASCNYVNVVHGEKETDVNIAVQLLQDAHEDNFDVAILVTGDSDQTPPIKTVRKLFPTKVIVVAFPPNRVSSELKKIASACTYIGRGLLAASLFPDEVISVSGYPLVCPPSWR